MGAIQIKPLANLEPRIQMFRLSPSKVKRLIVFSISTANTKKNLNIWFQQQQKSSIHQTLNPLTTTLCSFSSYKSPRRFANAAAKKYPFFH